MIFLNIIPVCSLVTPSRNRRLEGTRSYNPFIVNLWMVYHWIYQWNDNIYDPRFALLTWAVKLKNWFCLYIYLYELYPSTILCE